MTAATTAALVSAVGGAGTTRTTVELATLFARAGESVAVFDAAFATQGLADYAPGRLNPDLTRVLVDDADVDDALVDLDLPSSVPGDVSLCPVHAPFERVARAKTAAAAQAFEQLIVDADARFDRVLVDVPPIAANQAIAAVHATARTVVIAPGTPRGSDAVLRTRDVLADLGVETDAVLATDGSLDDADAVIPAPADIDAAGAPTSSTDDSFAEALVPAGAATFDDNLDFDFERPGLLGRVRAELD